MDTIYWQRGANLHPGANCAHEHGFRFYIQFDSVANKNRLRGVSYFQGDWIRRRIYSARAGLAL